MMNYPYRVLGNFFPLVVHYFLNRSFRPGTVDGLVGPEFGPCEKLPLFIFVEDVLFHHYSFVMANHVLHVRKDSSAYNDYLNVVCIVVNDYSMSVQMNVMQNIVIDPNVDLVSNYSLNNYFDHHVCYYHYQAVVDHANYHA